MKLQFYWGSKCNEVVYVNLEQSKYELLIIVEGLRESLKTLKDGIDVKFATSVC